MNAHLPMHDDDMIPHGTLGTYMLGFLLSIALTLGAFWIAPQLGSFGFVAVVITALLQLFVQLVFFLHLGSEPKKQLDMLLFIFTGVIITIVIVGTLWIMHNLEHLHRHSPTTTDIYQGGVVAPQNELH